MYYSILYQGIFGLAFLNFLVFWTDLFFSTYLLKNYPNQKKGKEGVRFSSFVSREANQPVNPSSSSLSSRPKQKQVSYQHIDDVYQLH